MLTEMESLPLDKMTQGERIRHLRMFAGLSVQQVAERWGRSAPYVYRVERDETEPRDLEYADIVRAAQEAALARDQ